jgi:hypothetical protein
MYCQKQVFLPRVALRHETVSGQGSQPPKRAETTRHGTLAMLFRAAHHGFNSDLRFYLEINGGR